MSVKVLTEDDVQPLLRRIDELEHQVQALTARGGKPARDYLTPKEVARRHGVGFKTVYAALKDGKLVAEKRPGHGNRAVDWRIQPDDARAWYDAHQRAAGNQ